MIPGEYILAEGDIECNVDRETRQLSVVNTGDRPIQVGSHAHFFEINRAMAFDRALSFGMRLDIPAGTAVRFEPGEKKDVQLVCFAGAKMAFGMNNITQGATSHAQDLEVALEKLKQAGFKYEL